MVYTHIFKHRHDSGVLEDPSPPYPCDVIGAEQSCEEHVEADQFSSATDGNICSDI